MQIVSIGLCGNKGIKRFIFEVFALSVRNIHQLLRATARFIYFEAIKSIFIIYNF